MAVRARLAVLAALALAACDASAPEEGSAPEAPASPASSPAAPAADQEIAATPGEQGALQSHDCRVFVEAYLGALERNAYDVAAEFWDDPVIDGERLGALHSGFMTPRVEIVEIQEEGAAGSLYCTVTGVLVDSSDPRVAPEQGEIVLRRVNDVPGASGAQRRWALRSSSFVEPMERSGRGDGG